MNWFSKIFKPKKEFDTTQRAARAAESILGNETLTSDLDDEAASLLIEWGLAWSERVAHSTSHLDDESARESMYSQLKAIRKLMRLINRWGANLEAWDDPQKEKTFAKILELRTVIDGEGFPQPTQEKTPYLPELHFENPTQLVKQLRLLLSFEGHYSSSKIE